MFSALCRRLLPLALSAGFVFTAAPAISALGDTTNAQARHIATFFPGRMTGSPAEMLSADYLRQQFTQMGYESDIRSFNTRYITPTTIIAKTGKTSPAARLSPRMRGKIASKSSSWPI